MITPNVNGAALFKWTIEKLRGEDINAPNKSKCIWQWVWSKWTSRAFASRSVVLDLSIRFDQASKQHTGTVVYYAFLFSVPCQSKITIYQLVKSTHRQMRSWNASETRIPYRWTSIQGPRCRKGTANIPQQGLLMFSSATHMSCFLLNLSLFYFHFLYFIFREFPLSWSGFHPSSSLHFLILFLPIVVEMTRETVG